MFYFPPMRRQPLPPCTMLQVILFFAHADCNVLTKFDVVLMHGTTSDPPQPP